MVEKVEIKEEETTSEKPAEKTPEGAKLKEDVTTEDSKETPTRPEGLPDKFKTVDEMAQSYSELEKKLGAPKEDVPKEETKTKEDDSKPNDLEIAKKAADKAGLDMDSLQTEYAENGKLADGSYQKLEKAGITRDYVDAFISGQQAVATQKVTEVKNTIGGEKSYQDLMQWSLENLTEAEQTAFNQSVNSTDIESVKFAVTGLKARYDHAVGSEPNLVEGKASPTGSQGFQSWAQVTKAMSDDRYSKDLAYQKEVKDKLANSSL